MAAMLVAFAAPAMADDWDWNDDRHDSDRWWWDWNDDRHDNDRWWDNRFDNGFFFGGDEIDQDFDQEAESGDVDQSFDVSSTGDNSNQTVGTQGVTNTGNAQNQIGVFQIGSEADDFEFDEVGSSIVVSPTTTTSSNQDVDQAASASD
jgi:hypothetical protein